MGKKKQSHEAWAKKQRAEKKADGVVPMDDGTPLSDLQELEAVVREDGEAEGVAPMDCEERAGGLRKLKKKEVRSAARKKQEHAVSKGVKYHERLAERMLKARAGGKRKV